MWCEGPRPGPFRFVALVVPGKVDPHQTPVLLGAGAARRAVNGRQV